MVQAMVNVAFITQHILQRPIGAIYEQCGDEKNDIKALQFLCIVDYHAELRELYNKIGEIPSPKLLSQLFQFRHYGKFRYYDYMIGRRICELTGPYRCILSHMAINHNVHIGLKMCAYCNKTELKKHLDDNSLDQCQAGYMQRYSIATDQKLWDVVASFYNILKQVSRKLKIVTIRTQTFTAHAHGIVEKLDKTHGDDLPECIVFDPKLRNQLKPIESEQFNDEFHRIMMIYYGDTFNSTVDRVPSDVIVVDDENERSIHPTQSDQPNAENEAEVSTNQSRQAPIESTTASKRVKLERASCQSTSGASSSSIPTVPSVSTPSSSSMATTSTASTSAYVEWSRMNDEEKFGLSIAQRLVELPNERTRKQIKCKFQEVLLEAEMKALE